MKYEHLRIIIKDTEFTIENVFDNNWQHLTIMKYENDTVDIYLNKTKVLENELLEEGDFDPENREFTIGNI